MKFTLVLIFLLSILNDSFSEDYWEPVLGINGGSVNSIAFRNSGEIYIALQDNGVYSKNPDKNWLNAGLNINFWDKTFKSVVTDSKGNIFAGSGATGIYFSSDNGKNWEQRIDGLDYFVIRSMFVDKDDNIYTGTSGGIYVSHDLAENWTRRNFGIGNLNIMSISQDSSGNLYAGTDMLIDGDGVIFISRNKGESWENINSNIPQQIVFAIAAESDSVIYCSVLNNGVYKSTNQGGSWTPANFGIENALILSLASLGKDTLLAGVRGMGVMRSADGGASWQKTYGDKLDEAINCFSIDVRGNIFAGVWGRGVIVSYDRGLTWEIMNDGIYSTAITDIELFNDSLYLGSESGVFVQNVEVWEMPFEGINSNGITDLSFDSSGNLFAGTYYNGLYIKESGDDSFKTAANFPSNKIQSVCTAHDNSVMCGTSNKGVVISKKPWVEWEERNTGFDQLSGLYINEISTHTNDMVFSNSANFGIYRSTNIGGNWILKSEGLTASNFNVIKQVSGSDAIIAGGYGHGIYISYDYGESWDLIFDNDGYYTEPESIETLFEGKVIYCGTRRHGVFYSEDFGETWVQENRGLSNISVISMLFYNGYIYAGTDGGGLYRHKVIPSGIFDDRNDYDITIFPNPAKEYINLSSELEISEYKIFDIVGRLVLSGRASGERKVDLSDLNKGIYQLVLTGKLDSSEYSIRKKLIKN